MSNPNLSELHRLVGLIPEAAGIAAEVRKIFDGIESEGISLATAASEKPADDMAMNIARANLKTLIADAEDRTALLIRDYRSTVNARAAAKTSPFPEVTSEISARADMVFIDNLSEICAATLQAADALTQ